MLKIKDFNGNEILTTSEFLCRMVAQAGRDNIRRNYYPCPHDVHAEHLALVDNQLQGDKVTSSGLRAKS